MVAYLAAYIFPAIMAMFQRPSKPMRSYVIWIPVGFIYAIFIGFRDEVGADWLNYLYMYNLLASGMNYVSALFHGDPAFWLLMVWMHDINGEVYGVNFVGAILFMTGLIAFVRRMPNPWLGMAVLVSYTMLAVTMGYVRQGIALGIVLWAITALMDRKFTKFVILVLFAAAFHKSAVIIMGLGLFLGGKNKFLKGVAAIFMLVGLYYMLFAGHEDHFIEMYVDTGMQSSGAKIRIVMNIIPALIFFWFRQRWKEQFEENYTFWYILALGSIGSVFLLALSSTVADRIGLYIIPLQVAVFSRLPFLLRNMIDPRVTTLFILLYYAAVLIVFLAFSKHAYAWLPYQNVFFEYYGLR